MSGRGLEVSSEIYRETNFKSSITKNGCEYTKSITFRKWIWSITYILMDMVHVILTMVEKW